MGQIDELQRQMDQLTAWVDADFAWKRRVRRDILAHELLLKEKFPDNWRTWRARWDLSKDVSADDAHGTSQELLRELGYPPDPPRDDQGQDDDQQGGSDPGDPPMPPLP
jgi:hypothetical protein